MGFRYCLNTSTIAGQKLTLEQEIGIAARAGYSGIEPWIRQIDEYVKPGRPQGGDDRPIGDDDHFSNAWTYIREKQEASAVVWSVLAEEDWMGNPDLHEYSQVRRGASPPRRT